MNKTAIQVSKNTSLLLYCGIVAGPLFVVTALLQAFTREGFDIVRHALSQLSLGDFGWIQIANFVISGLLFIAFAIGLKKALGKGPGRIWAAILVGIFGLSQIVGGVFVADPALGFPPGAPEGSIPQEQWSWHANIHAFAPIIGFNALIISFFVFARRFAALKQYMWMAASIVIGISVLLLGSPLTMGDDPDNMNFLGLWMAMILGWGWITVIAFRVYIGRITINN